MKNLSLYIKEISSAAYQRNPADLRAVAMAIYKHANANIKHIVQFGQSDKDINRSYEFVAIREFYNAVVRLMNLTLDKSNELSSSEQNQLAQTICAVAQELQRLKSAVRDAVRALAEQDTNKVVCAWARNEVERDWLKEQ